MAMFYFFKYLRERARPEIPLWEKETSSTTTVRAGTMHGWSRFGEVLVAPVALCKEKGHR